MRLKLRGFISLCLAGSAGLLGLCGCRKSSFPVYPADYREFAYVANAGANTVSVLDLVYLRPDRTLLVGAAPVALASNPDPKRNEVYVVNRQPGQGAGSLSVIDTSRNEVVATIPLGHEPEALAVSAEGLRAYIANSGSNTVSVVDLVTRRVAFTQTVGDRPEHLALAPDGRSLVVSERGSGQAQIFSTGMDVTRNRSAEGSPLHLRATFSGCAGAAAVSILPDSAKAFIACSKARQVMALNLAAKPDSWNARQEPGLVNDHLLAMLATGQDPSFLAMKPDGGQLFVSNTSADTITAISTTTNEVASTTPIGNLPGRGVVSADNSALWVINTGADALALYSIDDGKYLASLHTGSHPQALAFSADEHLLLVTNEGSGDVTLIRTAGTPSLFTMMPAGREPGAIAVRAMKGKT